MVQGLALVPNRTKKEDSMAETPRTYLPTAGLPIAACPGHGRAADCPILRALTGDDD
jgi:hypothetical protein